MRSIDHVDWRIAIEHYYADRLEASFDQTNRIGIGLAGRYLRWYRMIEAEWLTRARSERHDLMPWLELETIPEETLGREDALKQRVTQIAVDTAQRFGFEPEEKTLVSILAAETDAPWTAGRYGFCIRKNGFYKICMPQAVVNSDKNLRETMAHEYAHVVAGTLSMEKVPRWLNEALAMVAQGELESDVRGEFVSGAARWHNPDNLNRAFANEEEGVEGGWSLWRAYQQSGWIGRYLVMLKGERALGDVMRAYSDNNLLTELKIQIGLEHPTDEALKQVYGLSAAEVFEKALAAMRSDLLR